MSVRRKLASDHDGSNAKSSGSLAGSVTLSTTMRPALVLVNVQVTVSPAWRVMFDGVLSPLQMTLVRLQPATGPSDTEYVPGTSAPLSFGVVASARLNVWPPL